MARGAVAGILGLGVFMLSACVSQYEQQLTGSGQWDQLGHYHGEQGYRQWDQGELHKKGAMTETDYEEYRAGYLQGRFDYCTDKTTVGTLFSSGYPDECKDDRSASYELGDRGY